MSLKYLAILFLCITSVLCSRPQRTFATNALQSDTWMDTPMQHVWSLSNSFNTFAGQVRDVLTARSIKEDARATKMNSIQLQQDLAKVQQKLSVTQLELENVRQQLKTVQSICKPSPAITSPYFAFFKDFNSVLGVGKCFKKETKGVCAIVAVFEGLKYIARSRALVDNKALAAIAAGKQPENRQVTYASAVRARAGQYMDSVTSIRPKINSMFRFVGNQSKLALIKQSLLEAEERADVAELLLERTQARLEDAEAKLASDGQSLVAALFICLIIIVSWNITSKLVIFALKAPFFAFKSIIGSLHPVYALLRQSVTFILATRPGLANVLEDVAVWLPALRPQARLLNLANLATPAIFA